MKDLASTHNNNYEMHHVDVVWKSQLISDISTEQKVRLLLCKYV